MRRRGIFAHAFRKDRSRRSDRGSGGGRSAPLLEGLEDRLVFSVGGGWVTSAQGGAVGVGIFGRYYDASGFSGVPSLTRWDDRVAFFSPDGLGGPGGSSDSGLDDGDWSSVWTGTLTANFSEAYSFVVNSAGDGVRLWVTPKGQQRGEPLIDDWASRGQVGHQASMNLVAGAQYDVELDYSYSSGVQQIGLQWFSRNTPIESIEPTTQVGMNIAGEADALYANMVNAGTNNTWRSPTNSSAYVPMDSEFWPLADGLITVGLNDTSLKAGGTYTVQFAGMATLTASPSIRWTSTGGNILQAGQGYDPATNTTTATMVVPVGFETSISLTFTNTSRRPGQGLTIAGIKQSGYDVTVSLGAVTNFAKGQKVTISGFAGAAAGYNGTFTITDVNASSGTITYKASTSKLPANPAGGIALINPGDGITDLYVMRPSKAGGSDPLPVGTLFTPASIDSIAQYSTLRFMDLARTNHNLTSDWSDRTLVSSNFWAVYSPNLDGGIYAGMKPGSTSLAGAPWEIQIALANTTGKDMYINIPSNVSIEYIEKLADLFAFGSDGVVPYTSPQANPAWKPLNSNLKVYIEFSNELWLPSFSQAVSRVDGWANQLSQRAMYDYFTGNRNDSLYPGGGSNAYDDGAVLAAYFNLAPADVTAFLATYNPNPAPGSKTSPLYFNNSANFKGYAAGQAWTGLRTVQISEAFKSAFGETSMDAVAVDSRVRPLVLWQSSGNRSDALKFINGAYGDRRPVSYYIYGGGGAWYADSPAAGFSDVGFENPSFIDGLSGWTATGPAGPVANGSALGNPDAPPHFVPVVLAGGAVQSGDTVTITTTTKHGFSVGQTVKVSKVAAQGYNGTFTITAATATTFSYKTTVVGLSASGGGQVVGATAGTAAAYLGPGGRISQDVTFTGGYADITLVSTQVFASSSAPGLTITLIPMDGGPAINDGKPISLSEGAFGYTGNKNTYVWSRTAAFFTGDSPYTYRVTFANTSTTQTLFLADLAIQTVNGMYEETEAILQAGGLDIGTTVKPDADLASRYGIYTVGYEGGFDFNQNQAAYLSPLGYQNMGSRGFSSNVPNVGMYANLDPRAQELAVRTLKQYFAAGGRLAIVFQSAGNPNSWAVAAPYYSDWETPKQKAVAHVAGESQAPSYGLNPGEALVGRYWWLNGGGKNQASAVVSGTYLLDAAGDYSLEVSFGKSSAAPINQASPVDVLIDDRLVTTLIVYAKVGGKFTVNLPGLSAGRHTVTFINNAPSTNTAIFTDRPGTTIAILTYRSASAPAVAKSSPSITLKNPGAIKFGETFDVSLLGAVASVPGTFSFSTSSNLDDVTYGPASVSRMGVGVHAVSITFTPADTVHYATTTRIIALSIEKAQPTVFVSAGGRYVDSTSAVASKVVGVDASASDLLEGVAPTLVYYRGDSATGDPLTAPPTSPGVYTVVAVFPGSASYLPATSSTTFTIVAAPAIMPVISSSISSLDVAFGGPIDLATFDWRDLWLTRDGGPNLVTAAVTITPVSGSTYRISGLGGLTAVDGRYMMIVDGDGIFESSGRAVSGRNVFSWVKDDTIPIVAVSQGSTVSDYAAQAEPVVAPPTGAIAPTVADPESAAVSSPTISTVATIPASEAAAAAEAQSPVEATVAPPVRIRASARLEGGPRRLLQSARPRPRLEAAPRPVHEALPRPARDALRKFAREFPIRPALRAATARSVKIPSMASTSPRWLAGTQGTSA